MKSCIVAAAEKIVDWEKRRQPERFEESAEVLTPLIETKNEAHNRMLRTNSQAARKEFRQQQRTVNRAVDKAKEEWIRRVAMEGEAAVKDGRTRWESIRKVQQEDAAWVQTSQAKCGEERG